jgi:hypothetical protein
MQMGLQEQQPTVVCLKDLKHGEVLPIIDPAKLQIGVWDDTTWQQLARQWGPRLGWCRASQQETDAPPPTHTRLRELVWLDAQIWREAPHPVDCVLHTPQLAILRLACKQVQQLPHISFAAFL